MFRYFVLFLCVIQVSAHSLPLIIPASQCGRDVQKLFQCRTLANLEDNIRVYTKNGTELKNKGLFKEGENRIFILDNLVNDVCNYLEGVSTCMQNSYTYLKMRCPSTLDIIDNFMTSVKAVCTDYRTDISSLIHCINTDNSIFDPYVYCMQQSVNYFISHKAEDCRIMDRLKDCHCQFNSCSPRHVTRVKEMITGYEENMCFLLTKIKNIINPS